jgi:predicted nucleotide-binding protein
MALTQRSALAQVDDVLNRWDRFRARSAYDDCSDQDDNEIVEMIQILSSAVARVAPESRQLRVVDDSIKKHGPDNPHLLTMLAGILRAIRSDLAAGHSNYGAKTETELETYSRPNPKRIFVVHGRNDKARRATFSFLRSLGLEPVEWNQAVSFVGAGAPYIGDVLDAAFRETQGVLVLLTGDDLARLGTRFQSSRDSENESRLLPQPRPNVLFEAGMAFGRKPERTILVELGNVRSFTDVAGRHTVRISNSAIHRQTLADRLRLIGCDVQTDGRVDWLHEGDFDAALQDPDITPENVVDVGNTYLGKVVRLVDFGAFVQLFPGTDGMLHISEIAEDRINQVRDVLDEGDQILVKVLAIEGGKIKLSRKAVPKQERERREHRDR